MTKKHLLPIVILSFGALAMIALSIIILTGGKSKNNLNQIARFNSCSELATWLTNSTKSVGFPYYQVAPEAARDVATSGDGANSYSQTNVQVAGIDESDGVKTDGEFVYAIRNEKVYVSKVSEDKVEVVKVLEPNINPTSLYVTEGELVVIGNAFGNDYGFYDKSMLVDSAAIRSSIMPSPNRVATYVYTYVKTDWKLKTSFAVDGNLQSSRLLKDKLYLSLNDWKYSQGSYSPMDVADLYLPKFALNTNSQEIVTLIPQLTECQKVAYLGQDGTNLVSLVELDLTNQSFRSEVAVGNVSTLYMSYNNLYLLGTQYKTVRNDSALTVPVCDVLTTFFGSCPTPQAPSFDITTGVFKLNLEDMRLVAGTDVQGTLLNQYSVDERNDTLRIVTTSNSLMRESGAVNLFILDKDLNEVGSLTELAPGERVYSARFLSERLYLVTFKQVDPLFVIDLSNPSTPSVLGELKVTGYSDYLHNIGENKLLGFGKEVDARTGRVKELKISAFDATNPTNPIELAKITLNAGVDSTVLSNPKALYIESDRKRLAMPLYEYTNAGKVIYSFGIFEFDGTTLKHVATIDKRDNVENNYYYSADDLRIVRVNEKFIAVGQNTIAVYDYANLTKLSETILETTAKKVESKLIVN